MEAALRELEEEVGLRAQERDLESVGQLTFLFPFEPSFSQRVHVFVVRCWEGEPQEGREVAPTWFDPDRVPFERMWHDGTFWFPRIISGERIRAEFTFREDNETVATVVIEPWVPESRTSEGARWIRNLDSLSSDGL